MKTFKLSGAVTISVGTEVDAETLEEAIKIAEGRIIERYEWGRNGQEREVWVNGEYDGEVYNITEE